jgi:hypothetical protein
MLHFLPEWYVIHYDRSAAILQYAAAGILGGVTQFVQHAEGAAYIKGLETDTKLRSTTTTSIVRMLEGKTAASILATLDDQIRTGCTTFYTCPPSTPALGTSWLGTPADAPGDESPTALLDGVRKIVRKSLLAVLPPRRSYVMVVHRALRYLCGLCGLCGLKTFPFSSSGASSGHGGHSGGGDGGG